MNKELLSKPRHKQEIRDVEAGTTHWDEYQDVVRISRNESRKPKAHLELNLAKHVQDKKVFFKYISNKKNSKENVCHLLKGTGTLET